MANKPCLIYVLGRDRAAAGEQAAALLAERASQAGVDVSFLEDEREGEGSAGRAVQGALCFALGGDGTVLRALRRFARTTVPVFGVNFGEVGFLSTVEGAALGEGLERALAGDFSLLALPAIEVVLGSRPQWAFNDLVVHRKPGDRIAHVSYALDGVELGEVRADGLVVATPAGSTGYNLATSGPVLAWGVEGFVVTLIAPHALTARAVVAAPSDRLQVANHSAQPLEVRLDGRLVGSLEPDGALVARFVEGVGLLAQLPGSTFYTRLRDKFGLLAR